MVKRRQNGETGIVAVHCLEGKRVGGLGNRGVWSREMAAAAAEEHIESRKLGRMGNNGENPVLFLLEYADGLRAASLILNGHLRGCGYAGRSGGVVQGMEIFLHGDLHPDFVCMGLNIQEMFLTGKPQYTVERTLLVSGALVRVETPHLYVVLSLL